MAKRGSTTALAADPNDPEDFDVSEAEIARALEDRRLRKARAAEVEQVLLRLDRDVLDRFRATGVGWQDRINDALRRAVP